MPISPSTTCLLVVCYYISERHKTRAPRLTLHAMRHIKVNDISHIRLVNALPVSSRPDATQMMNTVHHSPCQKRSWQRCIPRSPCPIHLELDACPSPLVPHGKSLFAHQLCLELCKLRSTVNFISQEIVTTPYDSRYPSDGNILIPHRASCP